MTTQPDVAAELAALMHGTACVEETRDLILAAGADTTRFLHGQVTQNVEAITASSTAWSLLLQPNGRLIALLRLHRLDDETVLIDVQTGYGAAVHAALSRFLIRTKCLLTLHTSVLGFRVCTQPEGGPVGTRVISASPWPGWLLTGSGSDPIAAPVPVVSAETTELWRVLNGEPRLGVDLTDSTIPSETGLQSVAIAFGKGCYTGQELVERIDSRGRVVRSLMRLRSDAPLHPGTPLSDETGADRGVVTSGAQLPDTTWVAIAMVRTAGGQTIMANGCALTTLALLLDDA